VGYNPSYKWDKGKSTYNWGYNPLTKWDEPPSIVISSKTQICDDWLMLAIKPLLVTVCFLFMLVTVSYSGFVRVVINSGS
jgi:hypothetical protein